MCMCVHVCACTCSFVCVTHLFVQVCAYACTFGVCVGVGGWMGGCVSVI